MQLWVTPQFKTNIKVRAAQKGKSIIKYLDDLDRDDNKNENEKFGFKF